MASTPGRSTDAESAGDAGGLEKRSLSIAGHRTSIALEPEFWAALDRAADARGLSLPKLIGEIDEKRVGAGRNLASALRVFALEEAARSAVRDEA